MVVCPLGIVLAIIVLVGGHSFIMLLMFWGLSFYTSPFAKHRDFGKFYESGGKAFVPLAIRTKYMDVTK